MKPVPILLLGVALTLTATPSMSDTFNVEIDWLVAANHDHVPNACEIDAVRYRFQHYGHVLNIEFSDAIPEDAANRVIAFSSAPGAFDLGAGAWHDLESAYRDHPAGTGWHYAVLGHGFSLDGAPETSSGFAEVLGDEFLVSLGAFANQVGSPFDRSATFMHELGHNLGLTHAGDQDETVVGSYKPNYPSVMNYRFQLGGVREGLECQGLLLTPMYSGLDYSMGHLPDLDENGLCEELGVANSGVDWDCDGTIASCGHLVSHDVSNGTDDAPQHSWCENAGLRTLLTDFDDRSHLIDVAKDAELLRQAPQVVTCSRPEDWPMNSADACEQPDPCDFQVPASPANCVVPSHVRVVTQVGSGLDSSAAFVIQVRDEFNTPLPGREVYLIFGDCTRPGLALRQGWWPEVEAKWSGVHGPTDANGERRFILVGGVRSREGSDNPNCVWVYADTVLIGFTTASYYDQDGINGLTANDLALFCCDLQNPTLTYFARSDYDGNGIVSGSDLASWADRYFSTYPLTSTGLRVGGGAVSIEPVVRNNAELYLAWNDCLGAGGAQTASFACNVNTGFNYLSGSFMLAEDVDNVTGFEATIIAQSLTGALPDWWHIEPAGCRPTAMSCDIGADNCEIALTGEPVVLERFEVLNANTGAIRIVGAFGGPVTLHSGAEYEPFVVRVLHTKTTGSGGCSNCQTPVAFRFTWLRLTRASDPASACDISELPLQDHLMRGTAGDARSIAFWQAPFYSPDPFRLDVDSPAAAPWLHAPSPSRGATTLSFSVPRATPLTLSVYDVSGRRVRQLLDATVAPGERSIPWDGRDDSGRMLRSGYYILRLTTSDGSVTRPLIRLQ